jgi:2-amino-4-hydroxy-6-hydroxymethyldihydropteridine diphosphokinase
MRAYVGVGSNLGDRWAHLALAARSLRAAPGVKLLRASRVWDSAPMGPPQGRYLNAVLELETDMGAAPLLALLRRVERAAGRTRSGTQWEARTLDLDLLLHGEEVIHGPSLTVPHPGIVSRRFVLAPLAELCPECIVPGSGLSVAALLEAVPPADLRPVGLYPF